MAIVVLVTGSRDWINKDEIYDEMSKIIGVVTLIHGDCPTGADAIADTIARGLGWDVLKYPADWSLGKKAGYLRNKAMVDSDPDICLAFIKDNSRGASMTAKLAQDASIPTSIYREES